jgi:hypothetical protein
LEDDGPAAEILLPGRSCPFRSRSVARAQRVDDLLGLGEPARLVLRVDQVTIDDDVEDAVVAADQFGVDLEIVLQPGRQTGGSG